jgi:hypothetical protein
MEDMVAEVAVMVGVVGAVVSLVRGSSGPSRKAAGELTAEAAIREAMRGDEARAVHAEFRRRGVSKPMARIPLPPGLTPPM